MGRLLHMLSYPTHTHIQKAHNTHTQHTPAQHTHTRPFLPRPALLLLMNVDKCCFTFQKTQNYSIRYSHRSIFIYVCVYHTHTYTAHHTTIHTHNCPSLPHPALLLPIHLVALSKKHKIIPFDTRVESFWCMCAYHTHTHNTHTHTHHTHTIGLSPHPALLLPSKYVSPSWTHKNQKS